MTDTVTKPIEVEVGQIWYTSWGYDQTNIEYFQVVRTTKASAILRRIRAEVRDDRRVYPLKDQFCIDVLLRGNPHTEQWEMDEARGYSEKMCRKPRVLKDGYVSSSMKISDVRYAYLYEGGGNFDTLAAGYPGH